ncbi:MAG: O-antigen ligase family protein [Spirochaetia bacterium]|nr:O-antigen ligase family protein [Spirochaetia bacterium]
MKNIMEQQANKNFFDQSSIHSGKINLFLNYALIAFAFVLPFSRSGISIFIGIIPVLWIAEGRWKWKWQILKKDKLFLAICSFVGFQLLSLLWTDNYGKAVLSIKNYGHWILVPIFLTSVQSRFFIPAVRAFALGLVLLVFLALLNYFGIIQIGQEGAANVFMHRLDFSMFLAWSIIFGLVYLRNNRELFREKKPAKDLILWAVLVVVSGIWIFVQDGRSGQLALLVALLFLVSLLFWKKHKIILILSLIFVIIFFDLQFRFNKTFQSRVLDIRYEIANVQVENVYESSIGYRILTWRIALDLIKNNPVAGYGIGDSMDAVKNVVDHWQDKPDRSPSRLPNMDVITNNHVHNQYLQILLETGLIGLMLFLSIFYFFYKGSPDKKMAVLLIVVFFTGFVAEPFMRNQFSSALISFFMAWIYSNRKR